MSEHAHTLHALLYAHGGEMRMRELCTRLSCSHEALIAAADALEASLSGGALTLIRTADTLSLRTAPLYSEAVAALLSADETRDIGAAGLEVLAIVLYAGGASRSHIDYIRGVNSSNTLRTLTMRGLLERTKDTHDTRAWRYTSTPELLAHLGVASLHDLPEYATLSETLTQRTLSEPQDPHAPPSPL